MKKFLRVLLISSLVFNIQADLTEFYVQATGSNLNGGSDTNDAAKVTMVNGSWTSTTGIFIGPATSFTGVTTNDWASVYADGSTNGFVARVVLIDDALDTITLSAKDSGVNVTNASSGTIPTTAATGITMKIGGAWSGPTNTIMFPFDGWFSPAMTNGLQTPRINVKGAGTRFAAVKQSNTPAESDVFDYGYADYITTAPMVVAGRIGPTIIEGYVTTPGDLTLTNLTIGTNLPLMVHWVGHTNGSFALYTPWLFDWTHLELRNIWFSGGGRTNSASVHTQRMVNITKPMTLRNVGFSGSGESGVRHSMSAGFVYYFGCVAARCNYNSANGEAAFKAENGGGVYVNCLAMDTINDGSGVADGVGFLNQGSGSGNVGNVYINCLTKTIWGPGFQTTGNTPYSLHYNCASIEDQNGSFDFSQGTFTNSGWAHMVNSYAYKSSHGPRGNATRNAMPGLQLVAQGDYALTNAAYSQMNTSGVLSTNHATTAQLVDYANGNFALDTSSQWRQAGWAKLPISTNYSSATLSVPDIGPSQSTNSASAGAASGAAVSGGQ